MCSCTECKQKNATLGMLGWLPAGFGNACVPGEPCGEYGLPPGHTPPLPAAQVNPDLSAGDVRGFAVGGLLVNGLIAAGGWYLWKHNHKIAGGIIGFLGVSSAAWNIGEVITGKNPLDALIRRS